MAEVYFPPPIKWLPSVMYNDYRCTRCGTLLWDGDDATPALYIENKALTKDPACICKTCGSIVAKIIKTKE